jgi:hypothetical protein
MVEFNLYHLIFLTIDNAAKGEQKDRCKHHKHLQKDVFNSVLFYFHVLSLFVQILHACHLTVSKIKCLERHLLKKQLCFNNTQPRKKWSDKF